MGARTKLGKPFGKNSLYSILANEKYSGVYVFNRAQSKAYDGSRNTHMEKDDDEIIRIEGGMPAIISSEDFAKVKARMEANQRVAGQYKAKEVYLLSGLIYCGECGSAMAGNMRYGGRHRTKYVSYRCGNRDRTKSCQNKELRREYLESFVLSELGRLVLNEAAVPELLKRMNDHRNARYSKYDEEVK